MRKTGWTRAVASCWTSADVNLLQYYGGPVLSNAGVVQVLWNNGVNSQIASGIGRFLHCRAAERAHRLAGQRLRDHPKCQRRIAQRARGDQSAHRPRHLSRTAGPDPDEHQRQLKFWLPPSALKPAATAMASTRVDLPPAVLSDEERDLWVQLQRLQRPA